MREGPRDYISALRFHSLTRYFDTVLASTLKEEKFKSLLGTLSLYGALLENGHSKERSVE